MHDVLRARGAVIVAIVMIMGIPVSLVLDSPSPATAAPGIKDLGNGNKTVTWNFSTPSDYVQSNISLAGGDARLDTSNLQLVHTTDADFINNAQSYDTANLTISNGSISTIEKRKELVVGGDFGVAGPWRYSGDGNSSAAWDAGNLTGKTSHARSNASMLQFDGMNTGLVANWTRVSGGVDPPIIRQAIEDTTWYHEFNASFRLTLDFMTSSTSWAGLERTGSWDWTSYNILSLWMDTNHSGMNGNLLVYVHIEAGALLWDSATKWVTPGWKRYDYDISTFPDLSGVTRLGFRITNVTTNTSVGVWLDDVWLYHFDDITSSASISQDVNKADFTPPTVGSVLLSFRYRVDSPVNLTSASLTAKIGSLWSSPPINATTATGWTPANFDVSSSLTAMGTFNLSLEANLHLFTPFATSLQIQIDDISLTVPDHHGGSYTSIPIGIGSSVFFDAASWLNSSHPDTTVTVDARTGHSPVIDSTWTSWAPATSIAGKIGSFVQYRIILSTSNSSASVSFHSLTIDDHKYFDGGSVKTVVFTPPDILIGWRFFNTTFTAPPATSISFFVSDDGGTIWSPVPPNSSISFLSGPNITVRANLSTTNMTVTPQVTTLEVTYEFRGTLDTIKVTPPWWNGTADANNQFTATGHDVWGHIVPITPTWTWTDPGGTVDSSGLYNPGTTGAWLVCASAGGRIDCANVTISVGALASIILNPPTANIVAGESRTFNATGYDSDGNVVALTATSWSSDVGSFSNKTLNSAVFNAKGTPATGRVTATDRGISGHADVTVTASPSVVINGIVPNQVKVEDSQPWTLDLSPFLPPLQLSSNLMWWLEGKNASLYTVYGEKRYGQHTILFTLKKDAFGSNKATLWLENRTGARGNQTLWINITPVNDAPLFYDLPVLTVKRDSHYLFDYAPYIFDIDNHPSSLTLSTNDATHATVSGLTVNYTYDSSFTGQTVLVVLDVSDGSLSSSAVQTIKVSDNPAPNIVKPLPEVYMFEDVPKEDPFVEPIGNFFRDPDGETLNYSVAFSEYLTVEFLPPVGDRVRITPKQDWYGLEFLRFRATDPTGGFVEQVVRVNVAPVNDPPVLDWTEDIYVTFDIPYDLDLTDFVRDVDDPAHALTLSSSPVNVSSVEDFDLRILIPRYLNITSFTLHLSLTDGKATTWSNITVTVGDNLIPVLTSPVPDVTFDEDQQVTWAFDLQTYFIDPDSGPQSLTFTISAKIIIPELDLRNNRVYVNFSAPQDWFGTEAVKIRASDGLGFNITSILVRVMPINDAPVINPIPAQDLASRGTATIDLRRYVRDVDNNITELTFGTDSSFAYVVGYILVLDYRNGGSSETVILRANDTEAQTSRAFDVIYTPISDGEQNGLLAMLLAIALIFIALFILAILMYNKKLNQQYTVEDVFIVGREGRLIMHRTRRLRSDSDEDIIAGMFTAIMMFIKDSFGEDAGELKKFEFGDKQVMVERGTDFYLAGIYGGEPPETAAASLRAFTQDIEFKFGDVLATWSGDADDIIGLRTFTDAFVSRRTYRRGDWKRHSPRKKKAR